MVGVEVTVFVTYEVLVEVALLRLSFCFVFVELEGVELVLDVELLEADEVVELDFDLELVEVDEVTEVDSDSELLGVEVQLFGDAVLV